MYCLLWSKLARSSWLTLAKSYQKYSRSCTTSSIRKASTAKTRRIRGSTAYISIWSTHGTGVGQWAPEGCEPWSSTQANGGPQTFRRDLAQGNQGTWALHCQHPVFMTKNRTCSRTLCLWPSLRRQRSRRFHRVPPSARSSLANRLNNSTQLIDDQVRSSQIAEQGWVPGVCFGSRVISPKRKSFCYRLSRRQFHCFAQLS